MSGSSPEIIKEGETMRAWTHMRRGPPDAVLSLSYNLPLPQLKTPTQTLVRVHYAALNPGGSIMMQLAPSWMRTKPSIPEMDFAGTIVALGDGVPITRGLGVGTEVFGSVVVAAHLGGSGSLAEFVAVEVDSVVPVPRGVKLDEAAGLPVAGCTALKLVDDAPVQRGMKVLINAPGGGIGSMALGLIRNAVGPEGRIVALGSAEKAELARSLGADSVVDYRTMSSTYDALRAEHADKPFDLIFDALGVQKLYEASPGLLKADGTYMTVGVTFFEMNYTSILGAVYNMLKNSLWPVALGGTPRKYHQVTGLVNQKDLVRLGDLCAAGTLKVPIDSCWGFEEVLKAYERMLSHHAKGKVVVRV